MKKIIVNLIKIYQKTISPDHGIFLSRHIGCRFYPSCSQYSIQAINKYGLIKGLGFALRRIIKCHPFSSGGIDQI